MIAYLPANARSECVAPSTFPLGGVVEIMRMFHAAWPASQRPALSPTRGSGVGAVIETIGATGRGMTAGGGGGGGGGVPRPPRPPPASAASAGGAGAASPGAVATGGAAGGVLGGGDAAGGGVLGIAAGGAAFVDELAHAATPNAPPASTTATSRLPINRRRERNNWDIIRMNSFLFGTAAVLQHLVHPIDLDRLIGVDVGREFENHLVLRRAVRLEERVDHVDRALMMLDHSGQEQSVELRATRAVERGHLLVGQHPRHQHVVLNAVHRHLVARRR